jgi:hypothetical protein
MKASESAAGATKPFLDGVTFVTLAPKCYCLVFDKRNKRGEEHTIKSKG